MTRTREEAEKREALARAARGEPTDPSRYATRRGLDGFETTLPVDPDEVEPGDVCPWCAGAGKTTFKGFCTKCDGKGRIP